MYVTFEWTDGRNPPGRTITMAPAKFHDLASANPGRLALREGLEVYTAYLAGRGAEPADAYYEELDFEESGPDEAAPGSTEATVETVEAAPTDTVSPEGAEASTSEVSVTAEQASPDPDAWPDGYEYERSGSWFTVTAPDGARVGKIQGEGAARGLALDHKNALSVEAQ